MKQRARLAPVPHPQAVEDAVPGALPTACAATLMAIEPDGTLVARTETGVTMRCDFLQASPLAGTSLDVGDRVLVLPLPMPARPVVMGRVGRYGAPAQARIEASEAVSIRCGESSIDMRADGKVMIRGDDVLVRAKGTKRIRAGTVAIN